MKKITFLFAFIFVATTIFGQAMYTKTTGTPANSGNNVINQDLGARLLASDTISNDFEAIADFAINFEPWILLDVDGQTTYGFNGIDFEHSYEAMAFIAYNPSATTPPQTDDDAIQPYEGDKFAACFASVPDVGGNDDWLISPQISLGSESILSFFAKSYTSDYGLERFNVAVSTTGLDPDDFTIINGDDYLEAPAEEWTEFTFPIAQYDLQDVYVAIQCVSYDAFVFMVDNMQILTDFTSVENIEAQGFKMYPNPAQGVVNFTSDNQIEEVTVYNNVGQMVHNQKGSHELKINTSDWNTGIYMVQVKTEGKIETTRLIIE